MDDFLCNSVKLENIPYYLKWKNAHYNPTTMGMRKLSIYLYHFPSESYPSLLPYIQGREFLRSLVQISSIGRMQEFLHFARVCKIFQSRWTKESRTIRGYNKNLKPYFLDSSNLPRLRLVSNIFSACQEEWRRNNYSIKIWKNKSEMLNHFLLHCSVIKTNK